MIDELVYPKDISKELLFELLDSAYMPCELNDDGVLRVAEPLGCYVYPSEDGRLIMLRSAFRSSRDATLEEKLVAVNKINDEKGMIRAVVEEDGDITFDYHMAIDGGVTKANIVRTIRLFTTFVGMVASTPDMMAIIS